ncbi:MAG: SEC-C domain-containing protein [Silvanigrellaceae bacterium]|nr:SEC-C domain-containing protein [Silvanigrellaceae bacterium]
MEFKQIKSEALSDFKSNESYDLIKDPIEEMKWWGCWEENETEYNLTPSGSELLAGSLKHLLHSKLNLLGTGIKQKKEKIGRNDRCPCGSGLKYKKCCLSLSTPISKKIATLQNKR